MQRRPGFSRWLVTPVGLRARSTGREDPEIADVVVRESDGHRAAVARSHLTDRNSH